MRNFLLESTEILISIKMWKVCWFSGNDEILLFAPAHEHKLFSPSGVNAPGLVAHRIYCLEVSPRALFRKVLCVIKKKLFEMLDKFYE
jgi:hypothetical protein